MPQDTHLSPLRLRFRGHRAPKLPPTEISPTPFAGMGRVTVPIFPACRFGSPTDAASDEICVFPRKLRTNNRRSERRNTTDEAPKTTTSMARSSTNSAVTPRRPRAKAEKNSTNTGDTSSTASKIMPRINHMAATDTAPSSFFEYTPQRNTRCETRKRYASPRGSRAPTP